MSAGVNGDREQELSEDYTAETSAGLLSDSEVRELCSRGLLISQDFDPDQLAGCCYEFRVGKIAYSYDYEERVTRQQRSETHTINPFETLTIVTMEKVALDDLHFMLLFSKGSLFSLGLTPVSTAADPGFRGRLGITMTNLSARPIRFEAGMGFVKGAFFRLTEPATILYAGQHGDADMSWPYPSQFHTEPLDFQSWNADHWRALPPPLKSSLGRLHYVERYIKWIVVAFLLLALINMGSWFLRGAIPSNWYAVVERILNLMAALAQVAGFLLAVILVRSKEG